jgi:N-formylglutamate amidohydrolase
MHYDILFPDKTPRLPIIVHVPHASRFIPEDIGVELMLTRAQLQTELALMTDRHTDHLAREALDRGATLFVNQVSRLVCDPERFADDRNEPAARHGMGAVYTRTHDGRPLRYPDFGPQQRQRIMDRFYHPYHRAFTHLVDHYLADFGRVYIIDLHSYPDRPLPFEDPGLARPDVCLGYEDIHRPEDWVEWWEDVPGLYEQPTVAHNQPFAGSFVPARFYRRDPRVKSLMVELNRAGYMNEETGRFYKRSPIDDLLLGFYLFVLEDVSDILNPPEEGLSRRDARRIASDHLQRTGRFGTRCIVEVLHPAEYARQNLTPPMPYGVEPAQQMRSWIAYISDRNPNPHGTSNIVMVDRLTGRIIYTGTANDGDV